MADPFLKSPNWRSSKPLRIALLWTLVSSLLLAGCATTSLTASSVTRPAGGTGGPLTIHVAFPRAPGLFSGAPVEILGVKVGTVTDVKIHPTNVTATLNVNSPQPLPARVEAVLETPELLGEPDVELLPGYTGGPKLRNGATIPPSRTVVPLSTDQVLRALKNFAGSLNPKKIAEVISNMASDIHGEGPALHTLITQAASTISLLAANGNQLGQLSGNLASLTGTLRARTTKLTELVVDYDKLSGIIASHDKELSGAIEDLVSATRQLVGLLNPNLSSIEADIATLTRAGRTLDRNLSNLDNGLSAATALFQTARRAFSPSHNWLRLNLQLPLGLTGAYVLGLVRDRLSGICRRILANHSSGMSTTEIHTLQECGNPRSGFFNPIINLIPSILDGLPGGRSSVTGLLGTTPSPEDLLKAGMAKIPGVGPEITKLPSSQRIDQGTQNSPANKTTPPETPKLGPMPKLPNPPGGGNGVLGNLLHGLFGFIGALW
jgi:phospholipid/cholesterol/gamma-HCH transport system substrate-binding protein